MMTERIEKTLAALQRNQMDAYYAENAEEAKSLVLSLIPKGSTCASGGSVTLAETGILEAIKSGDYQYLDRSAGSGDERLAAFRAAATADYYLSSSNAITEDGVLYNVDGNSNRVAALLYGPKYVIVVAGINKLVPDLDAAILRVKTVAAPMNCKRLSCDTYCAKMGKCVSAGRGEMTDGCSSPARICCNYAVMAQQRQPSRVKVILVGESLGY